MPFSITATHYQAKMRSVQVQYIRGDIDKLIAGTGTAWVPPQ